MRITLVYQYFGTPKGSWSTRIYELVVRWIKAGHQVTIITSPYYKSDLKANKFVENQIIDGINLIVINLPDDNKKNTLRRVYNSVLFSIISTYYALTIKSDVLIASSGPITVGLPMLFKKIFSSTKIVFEVRDLWPGGAVELGLIKNRFLIHLGFLFERMCYLASDLVVSASEGQYVDINSRFKGLNHILIPNASDIELFNQVNAGYSFPDWIKDRQVFLHTGSIGLMNNCEIIIKAAKYIKENHLDLDKKVIIVFIGDGAEKKQLEELVKINQLDFVKFIGLIPKVELVNWVDISVATLFTAIDNPFMNSLSPNKIYDSFAAGKPVIQTTKGWIYDLFEREQCGINVECTPESLGNAIIRMASDSKLVERMSVNSKRLAMTQFNRDTLAQKYLNAIVKL